MKNWILSGISLKKDKIRMDKEENWYCTIEMQSDKEQYYQAKPKNHIKNRRLKTNANDERNLD